MFAGVGGIDLGFQQAGFEIKWANEKVIKLKPNNRLAKLELDKLE